MSFESLARFQIVTLKSFTIYSLYYIFVAAKTSSIKYMHSKNGPHSAYIINLAGLKFISPSSGFHDDEGTGMTNSHFGQED